MIELRILDTQRKEFIKHMDLPDGHPIPRVGEYLELGFMEDYMVTKVVWASDIGGGFYIRLEVEYLP
ncbi:hypothetical protein [Companilactobacillus sp.]|uniref:hypothetical protein n=1 Tax=Companilactobacillus sp. TaxID=2767905 RepID=UPI0026221088|nr:hypothetical protein [Companilactobacillus sp.]